MATVGLLVLLFAALAYYLYTPLPADLDQRGSVLAISLMKKLTMPVMDKLLPAFLGHQQYYDGVRLSINLLTRKNYLAGDPDLEVSDMAFDSVPVRVYRPKGAAVPAPVLMHFHGGGWSVGTIDMEDNTSRFYAKNANAVVVAVEYRLAPEHPFPAGLDDCLTATLHVLRQGQQLGLDSRRVAVAGLSAGGYMSAAVALRLQDAEFESLPPLVGQVLIFPCLQGVDLGLPSYVSNSDNVILTRTEMARYYLSYAGLDISPHTVQQVIKGQHIRPETRELLKNFIHRDLISQEEGERSETEVDDAGESSAVNETLALLAEPIFTNYLMTPVLAPASVLQRTPRALVLRARYDILHDDAVLYVRRLRQAGVEVASHFLKTGHHYTTFLGVSDSSPPPRSAEAQEAYDKVIAFLKHCFDSVK